MNKAILLNLLEAFQPVKIPDDLFSGVQLKLSPGTAEYLYAGAYLYVESVLNEGIAFYTAAWYFYLTYFILISNLRCNYI